MVRELDRCAPQAPTTSMRKSEMDREAAACSYKSHLLLQLVDGRSGAHYFHEEEKT